MLSCKDVTRLLSDAREGGSLPLMTRMSLGMHVFMCKLCARYKKQINFLGEVFHFHAEAEVEDMEAADSNRLPPDARERIRKAILKKQ